MDWSEYTQSMTEAWIDAQKTLWETWADLMVTKPKSAPPDAAASSAKEMTDVWSQIVQQNMESWQTNAAPIAKATAEQYFAVQETAIRFLEFSTQLWEAIGPQMEAGEDWTTTFEKNLEQFRKQWIQFPEVVQGTAEDLNNLWTQYFQQWQRFGQPWSVALQRTPEFFTRMMTGDSTAYIGLSNLYREAYQGTFARLVASPGLGLTREFNEKFQLGFDAWVSWQLATLEYQGVLSELWDQAFKQFQKDIVTLAEKGEKIETLRDFVLLWTRGAEQIFTNGFQTESYVLAQGQMLNAAMAYQVREQEIIEVFLDLYNMPTRSELDETHRRIYELRKEVKALRKETEVLKKTVAEIEGEGGSS
jgi:class III poly(R)-hydroxyalkanoic acid synthase PhaE subunit